MPSQDDEPTMDEQILLNGAVLEANRVFPFLRTAAPHVRYERMADRPDVAGRYESETHSVKVNRARETPLTPPQLMGLIGLERARGFLGSAAGERFVTEFPLTDEQRTWWEAFYLPPGVHAPEDRAERDKIIKGTMLSRLLVGDALPPKAPALTAAQHAVDARFAKFAKTGRD